MLLLCFLRGSPVLADVVMDDNFVDFSLVDLNRTTARVDIANNYVVLPAKSLSSAIDVMHDGLGYAVASQSGVSVYEYDDAIGQMALNPSFSCPWEVNATGVSIRQDNLNLWAVTNDSLAYYKFNGAGMSDDPALKVSGLIDVVSVAAIAYDDSALVLQNNSGKAKITRYEEAGGLNPALVFEPDIADPVRVSMISDTPDFRLFSKDTAYYFMYDDFTGNYVEDPAKKLTGLSSVISGDGDEAGTVVLTESNLNYYINDDTGGASMVEVLSPGPVSTPVAVSLKPGTYEQVFINEDGQVQWWTYDDAGDTMIRDTAMEISGLEFNTGYAHPRSYYSKVLATAFYDAAKITVTEDKPAGTSINYSISSDGGATFTPVVPGTWTKVPRGNNFVVLGILDTTDIEVSPKIIRVVLELEDDLFLQGTIDPQPAERGRNVTVSARVVSLTSGDVQVLDSCSIKYPLEQKANGNPALPDGDIPMTAPMSFDADSNWWKYTFAVPELTEAGRWPDDGIYQVEITGVQGVITKELILNLEVQGNILDKLIIKTTDW